MIRFAFPLVASAALLVSFPAAAADDQPLAALPYTPGLDPAAMDRSADACVDFYQYSCGGWVKANPIPSDQSSWNVYAKLHEDNQRFLWGILADLAKARPGRDAVQKKIGDYFAACMDEAAVEKRGLAPLKPWLAKIASLQDKRGLPALLAELQVALRESGGFGGGRPSSAFFFGIGSNQDFADSTQVIAFANAGGLGLPDRDYYTREDARSGELRGKYQDHVARMFALLGDAPEAAAREAKAVMAIENALARASLTLVERRDPYKLFHKMEPAALASLARGFDWNGYLAAVGLRGIRTINVTQPDFYRELARQWEMNDLAAIQAYLRWHVARLAAPYLTKAFVEENFDFYGKTLRGTPVLKPRWKRCVALVDEQLGEALGQEFVRRAFSPELKAKTLRMTREVEDAMAEDIRALPWMGADTKARALEKLHTVVNKIGYPDRWRDYSAVAVRRDDFFANVERAQRFEAKRQIAKVGRPLDRGEWRMTPPTVNAYYNPQMNDINFPAGVLQPPLYDPKIDAAPGYGNTGGTIGHELTHGFDDRGRQFDAQGNLRDWWTKEDDTAFRERAQCLVDQYGQYVVIDDIRINSKLTLGEDIADLGGLILAWMAWKTDTAQQALENRDGLTPGQRFFVGYAQWACENKRPEEQRLRAMTDQHSPGKYRVNGLVANMPEFEKAFSCKPGQPMASEKRCRVW